MLFLISSLSVSLLCVCLHCRVSSAYTSVHNLATHMCHLPYNCHLHSHWARLRHTKVACHIHVSLVPALTATRRSGILSYLISQLLWIGGRPTAPTTSRRCDTQFRAFGWCLTGTCLGTLVITDDSRKGHVDHVWVLDEDEGDFAMGTE